MKANKFWISFLACFVVIVLLGGIAIFAIPSLQTNMADSIVEKSQKYKDVCDENEALKTELSIKNLQYTNTVALLNTAQTSLTNEVALNTSLNAQLESVRNEKALLQASLSDKDADIQTLNTQIQEKDIEITNIQTMLDNSNSRIAELQTYIADLENQIISLNMRISQLENISRTVNNMIIQYMPEYSYKEIYLYNNPERTGSYGGIMDCYYNRDTKEFMQTYQGYVFAEVLTHLDFGYGFTVMEETYYSLHDDNHFTGFMFGDFLPIAQDSAWEFNRVYLNGELTTIEAIRDVVHSITYAFSFDITYNDMNEISNIAVNMFATNDGSRPFYID